METTAPTTDLRNAPPGAEADIMINTGPYQPPAPAAPTFVQPIIQPAPVVQSPPIIQSVEVNQTAPAAPAPAGPVTINMPETSATATAQSPAAMAVSEPYTGAAATEPNGPRYGESTLSQGESAVESTTTTVSQHKHIHWGSVVKGALLVGAAVVAVIAVGYLVAPAVHGLLASSTFGPTLAPIVAGIQSGAAWVTAAATHAVNFSIGFIGEGWAHIAAATGIAGLFGHAALAHGAAAAQALTPAQMAAASTTAGHFAQGAALGIGTAVVAAPAIHNMTVGTSTHTVNTVTPDANSFGADGMATATLASKADLTQHAAQAEIARESAHFAHHTMELGHAHEQQEDHARALLNAAHRADQAWSDRVGGGSQVAKIAPVPRADSYLEQLNSDRTNLDASLAKLGA